MRPVSILFVAILAVSICTRPPRVTAQTTTNTQEPQGSIVGQVSDSAGAAVGGATVELIRDGQIVASTAADNDGNYALHAPVGHYSLRVLSHGFAVRMLEVNVQTSQSAREDVVLSVGQVVNAITLTTGPIAVYNAVFSPTSNGNPTQLLDNVYTTLKFFIGPHDIESALRAPLWTVNPKILRQKQNLPLTITMTCLACDKDDVQSQVVTYFGLKRASTEAAFGFLPKRVLAKGPGGATQILVDVFSRGIEYDHLAMDVNIGEGGQPLTTAPSTDVGDFSPPVATWAPADLIITITHDMSGMVRIQVQPIHPKLTKELKPLYLTSSGQLRWFEPADFTVTEMQTAAGDAAATLKGIVDQQNQALQKALEGLPSPPPIIDVPSSPIIESPDNLKLTDSQRDTVLESFSKVGALVYYRLFRDSGGDLREIGRRLEAFSLADRPLRILIRAKDLFFPWQLLQYGRDKGAAGFWGFRYVLTVDSLAKPFDDRTRALAPVDNNTLSVFAKYKASPGEPGGLLVSMLAGKQADYFKSKMPAHTVLTADSTDSLLGDLRTHSSSMRFLLVYAHGSSGEIYVSLPGEHVVVQDEAQGPRIILSKDSFVRPLDLSNLPVEAGSDASPFFENHPVVVLNACETGTANVIKVTGLTFPVALLHLGAGGVIATESPVWSVLAYHVGNNLIDSMAKGNDISEALLAMRLKYLREFNNPFGLLYSYYGPSNVNIVLTQEQH